MHAALCLLMSLAHAAAVLCGLFGPASDPLTGDAVFIGAQSAATIFWAGVALFVKS